jgi:hypothetical protein
MEFSGSIKLTYKGPDGESYTTNSINTQPYHELSTGMASAAAVQAALRALPTHDLDDVVVSANYCETVVPNYHEATFTGTDGTASLAFGVASQPKVTHAVGSDTPTPTTGLFRVAGTDSLYSIGETLVRGWKLESAGVSDDSVLFKHSKPHCIRYAVSFNGRSGDVIDLKVDVSRLEFPSAQPAIEGGALSTVAIALQVATVSFDTPSVDADKVFSAGDKVLITCGGLTQGFMTVDSVPNSGMMVLNGDDYFLSACTGAVNAYMVNLPAATFGNDNTGNSISGTGSVSSITDFGANYATYEVQHSQAAACTASDACAGRVAYCKFTDTADEQDGGAIRTAAGVSTLTCADDTNIFDSSGTAALLSANLHYGERVDVVCDGRSHGTYTIASSTATTLVFQEVMHDCHGDYVDNADGVTTAPRHVSIEIHLKDMILKTNIDYEAVESEGHDVVGRTLRFWKHPSTDVWCAVSGILTDSASETSKGSRLLCSNTGPSAGYADDFTAYLETDGGSEANTCSDRGLCNFETGNCECFTGYTGVACETQNALYM